jgi:hypothetical protein
VQSTTFIVANTPSVDWVTAASGLLGVILGAALSYFVTYRFERRRTRDDRLAKSFSLVFAVMKIADDLTKMERDVCAALEAAKAQGGDVWTKLRPGIGYSEPITIPSEDLTVVALTRDQDLTLQVSEVEAAHRIYLVSMKKFQSLKDKFESFGFHVAVKGETVTFEADEAQMVRASPTIIELRTLSQSICEGLPPAASQAREIAAKLGPHLKRHYKFKHFVEMSFPDS